MNGNVKKRREERIREIFRDPQASSRNLQGTTFDQSEKAWKAWREPPTLQQYYKKWIICALLYTMVWCVYHVDHPLMATIKPSIHQTLTASLDFNAAAAWYQRYFADLPAVLPAYQRTNGLSDNQKLTRPAVGTVIKSYGETNQGIWLLTKPNQQVFAAAAGLVEQVNEHPVTGLTVVIRHEQGLSSVYGWLETTTVKRNDWVTSQMLVGAVGRDAQLDAGKLYFAIKRGQAYLNPEDVMAID